MESGQGPRPAVQGATGVHTVCAERCVPKLPYRLVYKTHFFATKLNNKRMGASYT